MTQSKGVYKLVCFTFLNLLGFLSRTFAQAPSSFGIQISPEGAQPGQTVDITITAIDSAGQTAKGADSTISIELKDATTNQLIADEEWTKPGDNGYYEFAAGDQGTKTFSKALSVKKEGTYKVVVYDILDESIQGEKTLIIGSNGSATQANIQIISPIKDGVEKGQSINVIAQSSLPNTPFEILVNEELVKEGTSDSQGRLNTFLNDIDTGAIKLQIQFVGPNNQLLAQSETIEFRYEPSNQGGLKGISIQPGTTVKQGETITITISTDNSISSAQISLGEGMKYPLDKLKDGEFTKRILVEKAGNYSLDALLVSNGQTSTASAIGSLTVQEGMGVKEIKIYRDNIDKTKIALSWSAIGNPKSFLVEYGISKDKLTESIQTTGTQILIAETLPETTYYFKITPLGETASDLGSVSDILIFEPTHNSAGTCVVQAIPYRLERMANKYYLVRDALLGVNEYTIYRTEIDDGALALQERTFQKIGTTTDTRFEYPFDTGSEFNQYAYFAVQGACSDADTIDTSLVKKVKVGPTQDLLLIILSAFLVYGSIKIRSRSSRL